MSSAARGRCSFRSLEGGEIELHVDFGIQRDMDSWLEKIERPTMLVTGASGFIGRYMVDLLAGFGYKVFATDIGSRPAYLNQEKFKAVEYAPADLREEEAVEFLMKWVRPTVVFHIGAVFDFSANEQLLRAVNVTGTERVCDAARSVGAKRVIYWSTGSIYASSDTPALETGPKKPADPYAASKLDGEYAAFEFHEPPEFQVYSVRPAMVSGILSRYGSGLVTRLMYEGYLVGPPQRRGMENAVVNARDVVTCGYLLATRDLEIEARSSDDTAFNAAADPVEVDVMMRGLGSAVPKRHVFGVRTKLAEIISFGYQEEVRLPDKVVRLIGTASSLVTGMLNQFRLAKLHPKIPPQTVPYMTSPHPMSNAKARELLGWVPDSIDVDLEETSRYYEVTGWTGFERRFSAEEAGRIRLFDEVEGLMNALNRRKSFALSALGANGSDADEGVDELPRIELPSLALEVDVRSLEIMIHAGRAHILEQAYRGRFSELISGTMPRLAAQAADDATLYLKYAYNRAFGAGGFPEVGLVELIKKGLVLDRDRIVSWILAANLARVFEVARGCGDLLRRLSDLLPEGGYAIVLETGYGDIALEYTKGPDGPSLQFIREELDEIPKHLRLDGRIERLRKARGLKLVVGALFDDVVRIFSSEPEEGEDATHARSFRGVLENMVCSPPEVLNRITGKVGRAGWTKLLFEDTSGRISIGINLDDAPVFMSPERLESYDIARRILAEDGFDSAMDAASEGAEKVFIYSVEEFRKLLSDAMSTGIVSRLLGR